MVFEMRHSILSRRPSALILGALALTLLTASRASAQGYDANKLAGKTFPEINKMLGKPAKASRDSTGKEIIYATYKTPGTVITRVIFAMQTKRVKQVQILIVGHSEQPEEIVKRFKLTLGSNPEKNPRKAPPVIGITGANQPPESPWQVVHVGYGLAMTFQDELMQYLKDKHLPYGSTYFWTLQLTPRRAARVSNQVIDSPGGGGAPPRRGGRGGGRGGRGQ